MTDQPAVTADILRAAAEAAADRYRLWMATHDDEDLLPVIAEAVAKAVVPLATAQALRDDADDAERVTVVFDQDSDDGWRQWMRDRADTLNGDSR